MRVLPALMRMRKIKLLQKMKDSAEVIILSTLEITTNKNECMTSASLYDQF